jgi:hypothetical protein
VPGSYIVQDRNRPEPGFGGLALPFPPAQGRLMLPRGFTNLKYVMMRASPTCGTIQTFGNQEGIWTDGISDCVVVIIMEWDDPNRRWTKFCFHHMLGSAMIYTLPDFNKLSPTPGNCWAVLADKSGVLGELVTKLENWGIPHQ